MGIFEPVLVGLATSRNVWPLWAQKDFIGLTCGLTWSLKTKGPAFMVIEPVGLALATHRIGWPLVGKFGVYLVGLGHQ